LFGVATVEHPQTDQLEGYERVFFPVEDKTLGEAEALWAERVPDGFRIDNVPLVVFGISRGDVVEAEPNGEQLWFSGVVERGGHSTYRVMLAEAGGATDEPGVRDLVALGCGYEALTPRFFAFDVPPQVDVQRVHALLERGLDEGRWTFDEAHHGHGP
jgi:hypothetical protein